MRLIRFARQRRDLWLPLGLFPAIVTLLVIGEFVWE